MRVGTELREARERAGLSAEQIAERTKIQLFRIEALENDNFEHLPSGIYLDGIVRAYAHEVAINPEPLIERVRFDRAEVAKNWQAGPADLDAFSSERQVANDGEARTTIGPSKVVTPPERGVVGTSSVNDDIDLDVNRPAQVVETPTSQLEPTRSARGPDRFVLPLLLLLAAVGLGAYFYVSTGRFNRRTPPDIVASSPRPAPADSAIVDSSTTPTTTVTAGDRSAAAAADRPRGNTGTATRETEVVAGTSGPKERAASDAAPQSVPRSRRGESSTAATGPSAAAPKNVGTAASSKDVSRSAKEVSGSKDVSGAWTLATHVESSSYAPFEGLKLGYEIHLEQVGDHVTGAGRKVIENGDGIGSRAQTPISVAGTIKGDRLTLTFNERGARRPTQGKFVLLLDESGTMRGRFSSTAAQSSGTVEAHRLPK